MKIGDFVKEGNKVYFDYYREGNFFYIVKQNNSTNYYSFPVPIEDIGTATLESQSKAITFMRWIRKAIENNTFQLKTD